MSDQTIFKAFFKELHAVAQHGDAREESFYPALADMLKTLAESTGRRHVRVTTLPKPTDAGNPDFRLWNGKDRIVGYVEAKKPAEERLDAIEDSEQLRRYRATFPNLVLTNFFEFRLYRNGELMQTVLAARPYALTRLRTTPVLEKSGDLHALLDRFLDFSLPKVFTAESLAVELAKRTRFLRDVVAQQLGQEKDAPGVLSGFFEAFRTFLIGTLTPEDFADLFAQTITYGLFAARTRSGEGFSRRAAFDSIPHTIGVLRDLFRFISLGDLPDQLAWCVDDIAEVLAVSDAPGILDRYYHEGKGSDPIVHFYETFLAHYDPAERERRGVYYTPEPVVGYIVRSLHGLLKTDFGKRDGLASEGVTLLDPAAGTMTFIARAAQQAVAEFETKYGKGGREDFIRRHILKNFYAFELMMAPYAVGHLKMSFFLEELGHRLADDERVPFYLTNTLDTEELEQSRLPGFSALAEESRLAGVVKKQTPILVILGNPPYSGHSTNIGDWIRRLIDTYKQVDDKPLGEKNPKWLQDDYVKFLRFAQWKIEQAERGVVGMITNHGYLDNPTFRGMRQSLMRTFDDIYILDLHGNSLKKETCPDGSPDKNVFDIRQGVAIAFFVKRGGKTKADAVVRHAEYYGLREAKYDWLNMHDREKMKWNKVHPSSPFYMFIPRDAALEAQYNGFPSISQVCPENVIGLFTARDALTIQWSPEEVWKVVTVFSRMDPELARHGYRLGKDRRDWRVRFAQKDLLDSGPTRDRVVPILYRPFDLRHTYYTGRSRGFMCMPRPEVMRHMLPGDNLAFCIGRQGQVVGKRQWNLVFCTNNIDDLNLFYRGGNVMFPLYLYPTADRKDLFTHHEPSERRPNLNPAIVTELVTAYGKEPTPEDIFHYIYAVLYAPAYRKKYAEFLKMDFPRIPFTADAELFEKLAAMGEKLVGLHLLKSPDLDPPACRFEGEGDGRIGRDRKTGMRYDAKEQRVYINASQHFAPVPEAVWIYQVGGYQVCEKWLKDRKERRLELDDIRTYCRIVTALGRTIELQREIDALYPEAEREIVSMTDSEKESKTDNPTKK
ncbi:MAG: type ISP restriction/modification enzyme [Acidobacteriota bacterium]|nr:type ISP restriction/modification enzyme [Acidobacteriota bacterium]